MIQNVLKKIPWLHFFYSLLAFSISNLILAYYLSTPPVEQKPITLWPIVFFDDLILPLILFLPIGFLFTIGIYLLRKKWLLALASFLVMLFVTFFSLFSFAFGDIFWLIDSLRLEDETVHLGSVSDYEGGRYLVFCSEKESVGFCDYFFAEYLIQENRTPKITIEPNTNNITILLEDFTIYEYAGNLPGKCTVASETLREAGILGNCDSFFHGGN